MPRRDQMRTPSRPVPGCTCTRARIPSVLGFVDKARADEGRFSECRQHRPDGLGIFAPFHRKTMLQPASQTPALSYQLSAIS